MSSLVTVQVGGISSQITISQQDLGSPTVTISPVVATPVPSPEYWWRADSGLSTTTWVGYNGGLDFTLYNVSSADSVTGVYFNGSTSYGLSSGVATTIDAKHIFIRSDSIPGTSGKAILGGTQNGIHEWYYTNVTNNWYIVEQLISGLTYASQNGVLGNTVTWTDLVNYAAPRYFTDNNTTGVDMNVYAGTYTNRFRWESARQIYLGRRDQSGANITGYIKEIAIFTTSLTDEQAKSFRSTMYTRWP